MSEKAAFIEEWGKDMQTRRSVMSEDALTARERLLIALGIGLAVRCKPSINLHVERCLKAGATREQILEAAGVAVMMLGASSFTHVPEVIRALDDLESKTTHQPRYGLAARFRLPVRHQGAVPPNGRAAG